jgi:hypothetical protein
VKEKPTVDSPFFGAFPSDRITKLRKDVNVHFFIHSSIPVNYTSEFWELSEATTYTTTDGRAKEDCCEKLVKNEQKVFIIKLNRSILQSLNEI